MAKTEPMKRTHYCGRIDEGLQGRTIRVYGWVQKKRELGQITFLDLRDREGVLQVVVDDQFKDPDLIKGIVRESVLMVQGEVVQRSNPNPDIPTGQVELVAREVQVLGKSAVLPFDPEQNQEVSEELRFKYRYLDLRNHRMQENLRLRSRVNLTIMNYLDRRGFINLETPMLTRSTPEGARDYLVPSRVFKGRMFALPQSPQLFKQLFMVSGFERYFQIVRCFRDEDLRADRQPEFTQLDIEMSFARREELFEIIEELIGEIFALRGYQLKTGFEQITYREAMEKYGTDAPDLRNPLQITDFSSSARKLDSGIINGILDDGGVIKGLVLPDSARYSRKVLDGINHYIREIGGKGVIWIRKTGEGFKAAVKTDSRKLEALFKEHQIREDEILLMIGGPREDALIQTGRLREYLWRDQARDNREMKFVWVTEFPLFFYNREEQRYESHHHPFTSPVIEQVPDLEEDPLQVLSLSYDLVLNGVEIGGGSRRIHDLELQRKIFSLLKLSEEEIREKFGFFLQALSYGAPPHLGIALGLDRIVMLLCGEKSIRDVICFPKTTSSLCLLTGSPAPVSARQLKELGINLTKS